ncbi:MAG: glycosyl hydrolase-related protein, partial [Candidatus Bathyarchaeota archaeon]|jgi:alpha-mannosidase
LRSVDRVFTDQPSGEDALERGKHEFNYAVLPHKGNWKQAQSYKTALQFNIPLITIKTLTHDGNLPKEMSFLSIQPETLVLATMNRSNEDVILRFYETTGKKTEGKVAFFRSMKEAWITNLLEVNIKNVKVNRKDICIEIRPFEIITLRIKL